MGLLRKVYATVLAAGLGAAVGPTLLAGPSDRHRAVRDFDWPGAAAESGQLNSVRDFDWPGAASGSDRSSVRDFDWPTAPRGSVAQDAARDPRMAEAESLMQAGNWRDAITVLSDVVADSPESADAYSYLGYCRGMLGDRYQALVDFARALHIDPAHRGALEYLGKLYLEMSDLAKAKEPLGQLSRLRGTGCGEYRGPREEAQ